MDARPFLCFALPILGMLVAVGFTYLMLNITHRGRLRALQAVVSRWNGQVEDGGLFGQSHAVLRIGNTIARLQFFNAAGAGSEGNYTHLTIHFPDPRLRLELYPQTVFQQMRKLLGMQDIEVGLPAFDDAFVIQGNNPELIREYLSVEAQAAIQTLASFSFFFNLHLSIGGSTLRVTKNSVFIGEADLFAFVAAFERLFLALISVRTLGIEFLPTTTPACVSGSHCQVCGEELQGTIVICNSCKTPHHLDCWQYFGSCAVYGCGQKRFVAAKGNAKG